MGRAYSSATAPAPFASLTPMLTGKRILLVVSGSVAAYKALEFTRLLRKEGAAVTAILTAGGARFVTREDIVGEVFVTVWPPTHWGGH